MAFCIELCLRILAIRAFLRFICWLHSSVATSVRFLRIAYFKFMPLLSLSFISQNYATLKVSSECLTWQQLHFDRSFVWHTSS